MILRTLSRVKAVLLDLDGVVTNTATLHTKAWKRMFDSFLQQYSKKKKLPFVPLDPVHDYKEYIDGRPRYDGVRTFLKSRGIILPYGDRNDAPGVETICGLGNLKNELYHTLLHEQGAHVYDDAVEMIRKWRDAQMRTAVISASRNCREVLQSAELTDLFDAIVDGNDAELNMLKGKPESDTFVFAAKLLGVDPSQTVVVEDAVAGVQSGKNGHFLLVTGVSRDGKSRELLLQNGADIVVSKLTEMPVMGGLMRRKIDEIPSALEQFNRLAEKLYADTVMVLLDYDGTLTPIVERPELAQISESTRDAVRQLARKIKVAVVSGRDLQDVKRLLEINNIYYSGSHGFEILGPDDSRMELQEARNRIGSIETAESECKAMLNGIEGVIIERKKFALAVHYRLVKENEINKVKEIVLDVARGLGDLKITYGKKVLEFRPELQWDKGKAVEWIVEQVFHSRSGAYPLFLGDDITDEDAFREVKEWGTGIIVGNHGHPSFADFSLKNTDEVREFLLRLGNHLKK